MSTSEPPERSVSFVIKDKNLIQGEYRKKQGGVEGFFEGSLANKIVPAVSDNQWRRRFEKSYEDIVGTFEGTLTSPPEKDGTVTEDKLRVQVYLSYKDSNSDSRPFRVELRARLSLNDDNVVDFLGIDYDPATHELTFGDFNAITGSSQGGPQQSGFGGTFSGHGYLEGDKLIFEKVKSVYDMGRFVGHRVQR